MTAAAIGWTDPRLLARVLPFALYMLFLAIQDGLEALLPGLDPRWWYLVKVGGVVLLLAYYRRHYLELLDRPDWRWAALAAPAVGLLVFVLWINLDWGWLVVGGGTGFSPLDEQGAIRWEMAIPRILGAALVVPLMEELFWRSFLARWIDRHDFLAVAPARLTLRALLVSSFLFGLEHTLWFAGILAGLAYGWLYQASGNLWVPIISHAVTNLVLGIWVLMTGNWGFW